MPCKVVLLNSKESRLHTLHLKSRPQTVSQMIKMLNMDDAKYAIGIRKSRTQTTLGLRDSIPEDFEKNCWRLVFPVVLHASQ